jgi:glycosyltransferase involved in cell wall biosynthesis
MIDRVHFPGQVRQAQLPQYYRAADLYVSASHSDGTSISLLEAMACGRPVLVSDIPGNREWVEPNVNGWLFPEGDVNALARAILHAVEARDRLSEMGKVARKLAQQRANWERNFPKLLEAYEIAFQE